MLPPPRRLSPRSVRPAQTWHEVIVSLQRRSSARRAVPAATKKPNGSRGFRIALALLAGAWLACVALTQWLGLAAWWAELLRFLPYPLWLLPALLMLAASAWQGWAERLASALLLAAMLGLGMAPAWGGGDSGAVPLRVMTFNVKAYRAAAQDDGFARMAWEVLQHDPDVVMLQDANFVASNNETLPAALQAVGRGRQVQADSEYLIASRYPLSGCAVGDLSFRQKQRRFLRCTVTVKGQAVDVVTAHFASPRAGLNAVRQLRTGAGGSFRDNFEDRQAQSRALAHALAGVARPLIVGGDFNALDSSPVMRHLHEMGLRDAFAEGGFGYGYTHGHSLKPGLDYWRIDHILVSRGIGVQRSFTGSAEASDHRPVIADLWLERAK